MHNLGMDIFLLPNVHANGSPQGGNIRESHITQLTHEVFNLVMDRFYMSF